jgi:uncharacterized membrane protein YbhN (UPF0104 family)
VSRSWRVLGAAAAIGLVAYFLWFAAGALDIHALASLASAPVLAALGVAVLLYSAIIPVSAWAWRRLLAHQGERWGTARLAGLMGLMQLAKYIPGNVAQHASRAALAIKAGMSGRAVVVTVGQETLLATAASLLVGLPALALSAPGLTQLPEAMRLPLLLATALLALAVLVLGSVTLDPARLLAHRSRWARALGRAGGLPGPGTALPALAAYVLNYLLIGLGLWLLARAAGLPAELDLALVTAAFSLAWLLGFLAPGAPAGLGVREGIMLVLLAGAAPDTQLLLFVMLARAVTLLGDGLCFLGGWLESLRRRGMEATV